MQRWDLTLDETISSSKQEKRFECQSKGDSQQWTLGQRMAEREVSLPSVEPEDYFGFFSQPQNGAGILDDPGLQLLLFMSFILKIKWVINNTWFSRLLCFVYFLISIPWVYSSLCWISSNWLDVLLLLRPPPLTWHLQHERSTCHICWQVGAELTTEVKTILGGIKVKKELGSLRFTILVQLTVCQREELLE